MAKNKPRTFRQEFLKPGFYRVRGEMREFSKRDLAGYKAGTNRLLHSGFQIPVLLHHPKPGSKEGAPIPAAKAKATQGKGWLKSISQAASGALSQVVAITDADAVKGLDDGSIKFTSPQFQKDYIDGEGREFGDVIRHVALTNAPRTQNQGEILACAEDVEGGEIFSFSEADYLGADEATAKTAFAEDFPPKKKGEETPAETSEEESSTPAETTPAADELPTNDVIVNKPAGPDLVNLVTQAMEKTGAVIPDGTDPATPEGMAIVLTAIINAAAAKPEETPEQIELTEEPSIAGQFTDDDDPRLVAMSEEVRQLKQDATDNALTRSRAKLAATLEDPSIPPGLCKALKGHATKVQFAEGEEEPSFSTGEVVALVKKTIPRACMDFGEEIEADHEDGKKAFENQGTPFSDGDTPAVSDPNEARDIVDAEKAGQFRERQEQFSGSQTQIPTGVAPARGPGRPRGSKNK